MTAEGATVQAGEAGGLLNNLQHPLTRAAGEMTGITDPIVVSQVFDGAGLSLRDNRRDGHFSQITNEDRLRKNVQRYASSRSDHKPVRRLFRRCSCLGAMEQLRR